MSKKYFSVAAVVSAIFASICCLGPIILAAIGLSGIAMFSSLAKYRLIFVVLTFGIIIYAFYSVYAKKKHICEDGTCLMKSGSPGEKVILWIITVIVIGLLLFPEIKSRLSVSSVSGNIGITKGNKISFQIGGMTCESCAQIIESVLSKIKGINSADVSFNDKEAVIYFDEKVVSVERIKNAIKKIGYQVLVQKEETKSNKVQTIKQNIASSCAIPAVKKTAGNYDVAGGCP